MERENDSKGRNMEVRKETRGKEEEETLKLVCSQGLNQKKSLHTPLWSQSVF